MRTLVVILTCCALCGCDVQDPAMQRQKKYVTYAPSELWRDGTSARPLPDHAVSADAANPARPPPVSADLVVRGRQRYEIYCTPCHGYDGSGRGMVVQRGFPQPPSYHSERLRHASAQHLFDVITSGYGVMYPYRTRVSVRDRWAIVAYIRALQLTNIASMQGQMERKP